MWEDSSPRPPQPSIEHPNKYAFLPPGVIQSLTPVRMAISRGDAFKIGFFGFFGMATAYLAILAVFGFAYLIILILTHR